MYTSLKIIAGTTGTEKDQKLASYLDFFASKITIDKITHLHVVQRLYDNDNYYSSYNDAFDRMTKVIKEEKIEPLLNSYKNVNNLDVEAISGRVISEFQNIIKKEKPNIVVLGKKDKSSSRLAKNIIRKTDSNVMVIPEHSAKTFTNILVPVDLSEHSGKLLANAIALQEQSSEIVFITCLHAYDIPDIPYYNVLRTETQMKRDTRETVKKAFDDFISKHQTKKSNITPVLIEETNSWPSNYILNYINTNDVDFVIMGTTRHNKLETLLGSTAERVITKNDKCPILIIK